MNEGTQAHLGTHNPHMIAPAPQQTHTPTQPLCLHMSLRICVVTCPYAVSLPEHACASNAALVNLPRAPSTCCARASATSNAALVNARVRCQCYTPSMCKHVHSRKCKHKRSHVAS
eukprot:13331551-Alexandrium_andersonii.AAC.1